VYNSCMENPRSKYDSRLTLKYITMEHENLIFDRKSALSKPSSLAEDISAFANAEGGALVIGINNDKEPEGIGALNEVKLNDLIEAPRTTCKPMPAMIMSLYPSLTKREKKIDYCCSTYTLVTHASSELPKMILS